MTNLILTIQKSKGSTFLQINTGNVILQ